MQSVVNALSRNFQVIQLGSSQDVALDKVTQLAGKTTIREAGLFLRQATLFIGLEGALMHLARAVDCPSVIVWGGRLKPSQIGYLVLRIFTRIWTAHHAGFQTPALTV